MEFPKSLFKYSPMRKYSIDMIKKGYLYFCPANKLDDQFECLSDLGKMKDLKPFIISTVLDVYKEIGIPVPNIDLTQFYDDDCNLDEEKATMYVTELSDLKDEEKIQKDISNINSFKSIKYPKEIEEKLKNAFLLQDYIGICSLAEENTNQVLWSMYANNYNGYCIEYDVEQYITNNVSFEKELHKVIYTDNRDVQLFKQVFKAFFISVLEKQGFYNIKSNENDLLETLEKIAIMKYSDWAFQKEWRIMSKPNDKQVIFPIKAVYLGRRLSKKDKTKIIKVCNKQHIQVYEQYNDYESLKICFRKKDNDI